MITQFIKTTLDVERVAFWPVYIDGNLFKPRRKRLQICYMPRKRRDETSFIREMFRVKHPQLANIPWVRIDGQSETATARIMGESAIFLALGRHEGLGLPPLEAMASGCLVVGFHGGGGREYARRDNALWVAEGDLFRCVDTLAEAVERRSDSSIHTAAAKTVQEYRRERTETILRDFWTRRLR
jgi:glycosyltransferase involved in cell wall biosynthesis